MKKYTVKYERDIDGWWIASVKGVSGCHTQGKTIEQSRKRIREALELFVENAKTAELIDEISMPPKAKSLVKNVHSKRDLVENESIKLQRTTIDAVWVLTQEIGVSMRDAGTILGLSHQRVHQLVLENKRK
ncbi:MAG: type II toxin-antitoxin system HicB family antitoxin [Candidatus Melainabacteria bacterium]|nr:type II toxin-antitoxin system HicB family antitoxin [Candidatus Melainabacteria bacterium]